jgi:hypothetical protein
MTRLTFTRARCADKLWMIDYFDAIMQIVVLCVRERSN